MKFHEPGGCTINFIWQPTMMHCYESLKSFGLFLEKLGRKNTKKYQSIGAFFSKWSFSLLDTLKNYRAIGIIPHTCLGHWLGNFCVRSHMFTYLFDIFEVTA